MPDLTTDDAVLRRSARRCGERGIIIPTFAQMKDPSLIPEPVRRELESIELWDVHPRNLFRITWKNEPVSRGGGFGAVNAVEVPAQLTGIPTRIVALLGKWFPTGAHKVGATFGCIVPPLVTGRFDPVGKKAVWPSTGNFCRGGAYVAALLGCESIAILPEQMSRERFDWLERIAGEVIATPGSESNVKEIFDACHTLRATREDIVIFNQFEELGNHLWHYEITGAALEEALRSTMRAGDRFAGVALHSGSAGTLGCGDYLKERYPGSRVAVGEALQCPTLLENGFGAHRIEGIGDKHVPWIHNVRNTDLVIAVDDELTIRLMRLFNEPTGREYLVGQGVPDAFVASLELIGISGIANLIAAIKMARYLELDSSDVIGTVFTDSMELYLSRLAELAEERGAYTRDDAVRDYGALMGISTDTMLELRVPDQRRIHNLKYYTWVEQQGRELDELNRQWHGWRDYWNQEGAADRIDEAIGAFNAIAGSP